MINTTAGGNKEQAVLLRKEAELVQLLRSRDGITIEKSADPMDETQYAAERDLAIRSVDRDSTLLRQVRAAMHRVKEGTFGMCMECDEEISAKRLKAVPWAQLCIKCQEEADQYGRERIADFDEPILTMA